MADFTGSLDQRMSPKYLAYYNPGRQHINMSVHGPLAEQILLVPLEGTWVYDYPTVPIRQNNYSGGHVQELGQFWFEIIHVFPRSLNVGIVLIPNQFQIDIYNAFKHETHDWDTYANNVDTGTSILNLPTLSYSLEPQEGIALTFEVTPYGPPTISGTLDFGFDIYTISLPVTGLRVVLFAFRPEQPLKEELEFMTEVLLTQTGAEQRIALRKNPRQFFDMDLKKHTGQRQGIETLMYEWQSREFGVPVWFEQMTLTASVAVDQTTISVDTTAYSDLRIGGLAVVRESHTKYDALEIVSFTSNTITFASGMLHAYEIGTEVMPVRRCYAQGEFGGSRYAADLETFALRFRVIDNDADLADKSAFPTWNTKVFLTDANLVIGSASESYEKLSLTMDNKFGVFSQTSIWDRNKRTASLTLLTQSAQELWEVRQLLHYLRGQQVAFYIPTSYFDLTPISTLINGGNTLDIPYIGFTKFVVTRPNKTDIRLHLTDGTILERDVSGSVELTEDTEQLSVGTAWPREILTSEILKIEFLEKVRLADDRIEIIHENAFKVARVLLKVKGVFD